jgi:hypothetical protein
MRFTRWFGAALLTTVVTAPASIAQTPTNDERLRVPANAVALEGTPAVRIEASRERVTRRELDRSEVARGRLRITIEQGRYFWASRGNLPLTLSVAGEFIYLASSEPGNYVRFHRVNDRISYVEHIDMATGSGDMPPGSVSYWGELRIELGK